MKFSPRLSFKILLLAIGNLLLLGLIFAVFIRLQLRQDFGYFLMTAGRDKARAVVQKLAMELRDGDRAKWSGVLEGYSKASGVTFLIYDIQGHRVAGPNLLPPPEVQMRLHPQKNPENPQSAWIPPFIVRADAQIPYWLGVWLPIEQEHVTRGDPARMILVVASSTLATNPFFFHAMPWVLCALLVFAITILYWLLPVRRLTRLIDDMVRATAAIAEGHFEVQVPFRRADEWGRLGASINQMATRLDHFTTGHNRFLGDIAHELRSPIARMQVAVAILERQAGGEEAQPSVDALKEDIDMMSALTDELLTFARAKLIPQELNLVPTSLAEIMARVVRAEAASGAYIEMEVDPSIQVRAESTYLFRSLANLVRNAVRYAGQHGVISLRVQSKGAHVFITVSDSGPGIPEEALDRIFTPFFRMDESRDRKSGGTGLGLAIVQSCIEACRGSVICRNRKPSGLEVIITLQAA